jgi:thioredoxin 1
VVHVDEASFESVVLKSDRPVLVDFWAPWCVPCRTIAPVLEEIAAEMEGQVRIAKLNIDENQQLAYQLRVLSAPTFILFKQGQPADRTLGALSKSAFTNFISRNL